MMDESRLISIVVPCYDERESVASVVESVASVMSEHSLRYELIMVDDGSKDGTREVLADLQSQMPEMSVIELRRNFGQTAAMTAGFDYARGDVIVPLDGDMQNDPVDIPRLLAKLDEGYDVVSGWRRHRKDLALTRRFPSWVANWLIGKITGVALHDYGCSLKAYRRDIIEHTHLYGEMHRFIPAIAAWSGARVAEMEVKHNPRRHGKTKYGIGRLPKVILDLVTVKFLGTFSTKPLHVFGGIGLITLLLAMVSSVVVVYQKYFSETELPMNRNPLLNFTVLFVMMSVQFLLMGLLAEMLARTYHESQGKSTYVIRRILDSQSRSSDKADKGAEDGKG